MGRRTRSSALYSSDCYYCGAIACEIDHVFPYGFSGNNTPMVPCCRICNALLSCRVFPSEKHKGAYLYLRLKKRYAGNIRDYKRWKDEDLSQYGRNLKTVLLKAIKQGPALIDQVARAKEHFDAIPMEDQKRLKVYVRTGDKAPRVMG